MTSLDLICRSRSEIGMFGSYYFAGWALMVLIVPPLSDRYGRRKISLVSMVIQTMMTSCLLLSRQYWITCLCIFILGLNAPGRANVGFIYMTEFFSKHGKGITGTVSGIFECSILSLYVVIFLFISNDTNYALIFATSISVISFLGLLWLDESP